MSVSLTIARPYAKALFNSAVEREHVELWGAVLNVLAELCSAPAFLDRSRDPKISPVDLTQFVTDLVTTCVPDVKSQAAALAVFVELLVESGRLAIAPAIRQLFVAMVADRESTRNVEVFSALPLSTEQLNHIQKALERKFACQVSLSCTEDSDLIGGVKLVSGSWVVDGSVKNRLDSLRHSLRNLM